MSPAIWVFHGAEISTTSGPFRAFAEIAGGLAAVALGLWLLSGRGTGPRPEADQPGGLSRWTVLLGEQVSTRRAALAGPLTHLPGLLYLVAIDLILAEEPSAEGSLVDLLIYNGLWFFVPIAALALSIIRPGSASRAVTAAEPFAHKHGRLVLAIVCLTLGGALLVRGLVVS